MRKKYDDEEDTLRPEYDVDYSKAVWGKYSKRLMEEGSNVVLLKPDVAKVFKDSNSVNQVLRSLSKISNDSDSINKALRHYIKALELPKKQTTKSRKAAVKHKSAAN